MSSDAFAAFASRANEMYARDNIRSGRWSASDAAVKATEEFQHMLPRGIETPDHYIYDVRNALDQTVGHVWFACVGSGDSRAGYVYWIQIDDEHRRQGHGRAALIALEHVAAGLGLNALRLNVFAHNPNAEALYRSMGYQVTAMTMRKPL